MHTADVPGGPIRCGVLLITAVLGCTATGGNLTGLAGPVMQHPAVWAFYWGRGFAAHPDYVSALNHGLENMVGDQFADPNSTAYYGPLGQYGVNRGQLLGYQVVNENPDGSVGSWNYFDIAWFVLTHRWNSDAPHYWWRWSDQDPLFAIFVDGSKVDSSGWAGYHAFAVTEGILFAFLVHPAMPYLIVKTPALNSLTNDHSSEAWHRAVDVATERASHEHVETTTDPYPFTAWADPLKEPIWENGEIADICSQGSSYPAGKATRVIKDGSALATYWSNRDQICMPNARPSAVLALPHDGDTVPWLAPVTLAVKNDDLFDNGPVSCAGAIVPECGVRWDDDKDGKGIARGSIATTSQLSVGTHHISVTVTDSQGGVRVLGPVAVNVVAKPPNVTIDRPATGTSFGSDQTINFRGLAFDPQQGDLAPSASWSVDGAPVGAGATLFQHRISTEGTHTVTLSATNGANLSSSSSITVTIGPATGKPTVAITDPAGGTAFGANTPITFTATATAQGSATVPDSGYSWTDDITGQLGTGHTITHKLSGSLCDTIVHHVTVTATDTLGRSATDTITLQVGGIC